MLSVPIFFFIFIWIFQKWTKINVQNGKLNKKMKKKTCKNHIRLICRDFKKITKKSM